MLSNYDYIHPDDHLTFKETIQHSAEMMTLWDHEFRVITLNNEAIWINCRSNPRTLLDGSILWNGVLTDITESKQAEKALQVSEERFKTQMIQSPMVMEIYDLDGLQIEVNKAYEELWGFSADTTVNILNVLQSKEVEETGLMEHVKRAYSGETVTLPEYEFDPTGKTESGGPGRIRWLSTKIYPLKDTDGKVTNIVITHEDVTDRKQAEAALQKSNEKFKRITERIYDVIITAQLDDTISYMSPSVKW